MSNRKSGSDAARIGAVTQAVDTASEELVDISLDIHAHPETNYQEYHAAKLLSDALERHGGSLDQYGKGHGRFIVGHRSPTVPR